MEEINRLSLTDKCGIEDRTTVKGVVIIRDEDGKIIFRGNNMVVKSGRQSIYTAFTSESKIALRLNELNAFVGDNSTMVSRNDTYSGNGYTQITQNRSSLTVNTSNTSNTFYVKDSETNHIKGVTGVNVNPDDFMLFYTPHTESNLSSFQGGIQYYTLSNNEYVRVNTANGSPVSGTTYYTMSRTYSNTNTIYFLKNDKELYIHMGINYNPGEKGPEYVSTFGLFSGETLFSRIVFPRRVLSKNTPLIIDYYLYF